MLEETLSTLFREPMKIVGSGRTDAGVHCEQQFFHVDIEHPFDERQLLAKLNSFLPQDIAIVSIRAVRDTAHARYSAVSRTYEYRITLEKNPFLHGRALRWHKSLDFQTMDKATALIVGTRDFRAFSKVKTDVNHFICDIRAAQWKLSGSVLVFRITANRFLRGMVRALTGTLLDVGQGKLTIRQFRDIIKSGDRRKAGANVAPYGLYLTRVAYPRSVFLINKQEK